MELRSSTISPFFNFAGLKIEVLVLVPHKVLLPLALFKTSAPAWGSGLAHEPSGRGLDAVHEVRLWTD